MVSAEAVAHEQRLRERRENPPEPPEGLGTLEVVRLANDLFASWAADADAVVSETDAGGPRALWVEPPAADRSKVILYFHGGAYILGTADHVVGMLSHLVGAAGCRALSVDYRLAPEHPFPAAVDDAVASYEWLLEQVPPEHIVVGGDSAGGGLTLALLLALGDRGLPQPAGAVPISPWADVRCEAPAWRSNAETDLLLELERLTEMATLYLQGADAAEPLASPVLGDYAGVAPLYIQAAGYETLLDDCFAVAAAAARDGVDVRLDVFPRMQHVFQYCAGAMPEADDAIARIAAWIRRRLDPSARVVGQIAGTGLGGSTPT